MADKTLAERPLYEEVRDAFDGDDVVAKNIALKKAALAIDAKDAEIARLERQVAQMRGMAWQAENAPLTAERWLERISEVGIIGPSDEYDDYCIPKRK